MLEFNVRLVNSLGLHARAAAKLVRCSAEFGSRITVRNVATDASANAKSILSLLALAASLGTVLALRVEGADEEAAAERVRELFETGFGEM